MPFSYILLGSGFLSGLLLVVLMAYITRRQIVKEAHGLAKEITDDANELAQEILAEIQSEAEEFRDLSMENFEKDIQGRRDRIEKLAADVEEKRQVYDSQLEARTAILNKKQSLFDRLKNRVDKKQARIQSVKSQRTEIENKIKERLISHSQADVEELKNHLKLSIVEKAKERVTKEAEWRLDEAQQHAERNAKQVIDTALSRFARPYCSERGISYVHMVNEATRDRVFGPEKTLLKEVEKLCGVDLIYNEEMNSVSVSGFDPVRRELGRASLERLTKERQIDSTVIENVVKRTKKELFKNIKRDGLKIAKELRCRDLHPEILHRMGSLRYRYSFAQNQYFHCGEVGFLCGLLSAELGLDQSDGRRSGLLHDIGKSMDHSLDGGHAVIGADFIEKYNEKPEIVHAVRAHHYDETPSTDLAFLVIAADALSGARPGARRSTADSYMQKMNQLEVIGNSFPGVQDTYIMSAGREVRVVVDSREIDDYKALSLSRDIAHKIEQEVNYPGLIKVTVVRRTEAVEVAK